MLPKKARKGLILNLVFLAGLIGATIIILNLGVGAFTMVVPILAALIFLAILLLPDDQKDKK